MGKKTESTVTDQNEYCYFCGSPYLYGEHHLIFGSAFRELAEEDGLKVPVCSHCHTAGKVLERVHDNPMAENLSKMLGQAIYERNLIAEEGITIEQAKERFRKRYGRFFL